MGYFLAFLSALGAIVSIVLWVREHWSAKRALVYPVLVTVLTGFAVWEYQANHKRDTIRAEARELISTWQPIDRLEFESKGRRIGIYLSGLALLEKYRKEFPGTYAAAAELKTNRLRNFEAPDSLAASLHEYDLMEDAAGAMIQLVISIAR
jgi:hypothetical protein